MVMFLARHPMVFIFLNLFDLLEFPVKDKDIINFGRRFQNFIARHFDIVSKYNVGLKTLLLHGRGWSGGAKVLGKLPVPGRPTDLDYSRARAYCACSGCGWGLFGHFYSHLSFLSSFSLSLGDGPI